jgi:molybdopterin-guanine dinucleotide biosynthesis protein A
LATIAGVILAGGLATRMGGGDKGLLPLDGGTLLDKVIARLAPQCGTLALNANGDPSRFATFGLPVIADPVAEYPGPLAGILAGLDWAARQGADMTISAAADTPFLPLVLVERLQAQAEATGAKIVLAASPDDTGTLRRHPTFGLWSVSLQEDLRAALERGERKVVAWADRHGAATAPFEADGFDPFFNINTPDDLAKARGMLASAQPKRL